MFSDFESESVKEYSLIGIAVFILGIAISGFGLLQFFVQSAQASPELVASSSASLVSTCQDKASLGVIVVDISGAVKKPGIYELETGSRVNDVVAKAGGFSQEVDRYFVNKNFNLSSRLTDGKKIYIPTLKDSLREYQTQVVITKEISSNEVGLVAINSASKEQLISLTGIGEKRAEDIIEHRPYSSIRELVDKKVITEGVFSKIEDKLKL